MIWVDCTIQRIKKEMLYIYFLTVLFITHMFRSFLFRPCNCKHWLKFQQSWAKHCFRIDGLEPLDTISQFDLYELMTHAAIQHESPLICIVKLTLCDEHEPL